MDQFRGDPRWHQPPEVTEPEPHPVAATVARRPTTAVEPTGRHSLRDRTPEPAPAAEPEATYGRVLGLTLAWYGVPVLLSIIWLIAMDSDRRSTANRELLTNLPWVFTAVVLSVTIAWLMRWASIGWRTWTLTFAAAIIGAGVATIAHSFTL